MKDSMRTPPALPDLDEDEIKLLKYRAKAFQYADRLASFCKIYGDDEYDHEAFVEFRDCNLIEAAYRFAADENFGALSVLFEHHGDLVLPFRLDVLRAIPETTSPRAYERLLPGVDEGIEDEWTVHPHRREKDYVEWLVPDDVLGASAVDAAERAPQLPAFVRRPVPCSAADVTAWYVERAAEIEERSGLVRLALELLELGEENDVEGLADIRRQLEDIGAIVYECGGDVSLAEYRTMSDDDKLDLLMTGSSATTIIDRYRKRAVPFLRRVADPIAVQHDYLVRLATRDLDAVAQVVKQSNPTLPSGERIMTDVFLLLSTAVDAVYASPAVDAWATMSLIFESLPVRDLHNDVKNAQIAARLDEYNALQDRVDAMETHLGVGETLDKYGVGKPMAFLAACPGERPAAELRAILADMLIFQSHRYDELLATRRTGDAELERGWRALHHDMLQVQGRLFAPTLDADIVHELVVAKLLRIERFELAVELLIGKSDKVVLPGPAIVKLVVEVAREYVNSAAGANDDAIALAERCLAVLPVVRERAFDDDEEIWEHPAVHAERHLIEAVRILSDLDMALLPVQLRLMDDKGDLIGNILASVPVACTKIDTLLRLARLLDLATPEQQNAVRVRVADAAMDHKEYETAMTLCQRVMQDAFADAWTACRRLATTRDAYPVLSRRDRSTLLAFAVAHCPPDEVDDVLGLWQRADEGKVAAASGIFTKTLSRDATLAELQQGFASLRERTPQPMIRQCTRNAVSAARRHVFFPSHVPVEERHEADAILAAPAGSGKTPKDLSSSMRRLLVNQAGLRVLRTHLPASEHDAVLDELALDSLDLDVADTVTYLLCMRRPAGLQTFFDRLLTHFGSQVRDVDVVTKLALWTYARYIAHDAPWNCGLSTLVDKAAARVDAWKREPETEDRVLLAEQFRRFGNLIRDTEQARELQQVNTDIDTALFAVDPQYRVQVVLKMARSFDADSLETAMGLCAKYDIARWDVASARAVYVMLPRADGPDLATLRERIRDVDTILFERPDESARVIERDVLPHVPGTKHRHLDFVYSVLLDCAKSADDAARIEHLENRQRLIRALHKLVPALDMTAFLAGPPEDQIAALFDRLPVESVPALADAVKGRLHIAAADGGEEAVTASHVNLWYARKIMAMDELALEDKWAACADVLGRLSGPHLAAVVRKLNLAEQDMAVQRRIVADVHAMLVENKKKAAKAEFDDARALVADMHVRHGAADALRAINVDADSIEDVRQSAQEAVDGLLDQLARSGAEPSSIDAVLEVIDLPDVAVPPSASAVVTRVFDAILASDGADADVRAAQAILRMALAHRDAGEALPCVDDVLAKAGQHAELETTPSRLRVCLYDSLAELRADDSTADVPDDLAFRRVEAIVRDAWPDAAAVPLAAADLDDVGALATRLLAAVASEAHVAALIPLVLEWHGDGKAIPAPVWTSLASRGSGAMVDFLLANAHAVVDTPEDLAAVVRGISSRDPRGAILFGLERRMPAAIGDEALAMALAMADEPSIVDDAIVARLLARGHVAALCATPLFDRALALLLASAPADDFEVADDFGDDEAAGETDDASFRASFLYALLDLCARTRLGEAAYLLARRNGLARPFCTLDLLLPMLADHVGDLADRFASLIDSLDEDDFASDPEARSIRHAARMADKARAAVVAAVKTYRE